MAGNIVQGQNANASDFINKSERDATKTNDAGRVPKLEASGFLSEQFLNKGKASITYNQDGKIATFVDTRSSPNVTYTLTWTGDFLTSFTDGTTTWTITWVDDKITSITSTI